MKKISVGEHVYASFLCMFVFVWCVCYLLEVYGFIPSFLLAIAGLIFVEEVCI